MYKFERISSMIILNEVYACHNLISIRLYFILTILIMEDRNIYFEWLKFDDELLSYPIQLLLYISSQNDTSYIKYKTVVWKRYLQFIYVWRI
jgi:hypothetical protein